MTPKEKAFELVDKMYNVDFNDLPEELAMKYVHAKKCALIAVDEIISSHMIDGIIDYDVYIYWESVIEEIEKL